MNQSLLKRERVNKRFQGRARRARTTRSVHLTVNGSVVEICRTNLREHVHCSRIDEKHGGVFDAAIAIACYVTGDSSFNRPLLFKIERGDDLITPKIGRAHV